MKYIKSFEYLNIGEPEAGDYVILNSRTKPEYNNIIGIINSIYGAYCIIKIENKLIKILSFDIKYWTKNRRSLEDKLK